MKKTILFLGLSIGMILAFSSCKKKGCTDANAKNYCDECKKDDASCTYEGSVQFWYDQTTATNLVADGSNSLTYYIDGVIVGSSSASVYFTGDPSCTQSGVVRSTKDLGKEKSKTSTFKVVDDLGDEIWSTALGDGNVTYDATKSCTSIKLVY